MGFGPAGPQHSTQPATSNVRFGDIHFTLMEYKVWLLYQGTPCRLLLVQRRNYVANTTLCLGNATNNGTAK